MEQLPSQQTGSETDFVKEKKYGVGFYTMPPGNFVYEIPFLINLQDKELTIVLLREIAKLRNVFIENIPEQVITILKENIPS